MTTIGDLREVAEELRKEISTVREEANKLARKFAWGPWEPYTLKLPRRIKGRWYWPGASVYRREKMSFRFRPYDYEYGDEFDVLKDN